MNRMSILAACAASGALISGAPAALAGGFVAPSVEVEPVVAAPVATTGDWAGACVGGSIGYSFGAVTQSASTPPTTTASALAMWM